MSDSRASRARSVGRFAGRRWRRALACVAAAVGMGAAAVGMTGSASASNVFDPEQFAIESFTTATSHMRAGGHPDVSTSFAFHRGIILDALDRPEPVPYGRARRIEIDMPAGLVGDPTKLETCPLDVFYSVTAACPVRSQVGVGALDVGGFPVGAFTDVPVYNLEHGPDEPVLLGVKPNPIIYAFIRVKVRPDGGLTAIVDELNLAHPLVKSELTLWGVPADHHGGGGPRIPFMTGPTQCDVIPTTTMRAYSYEGKVAVARHSLDTPPVECDQVPFEPTMTATPTDRRAAGPTGLDVAIDLPQVQRNQRMPAHVRSVRIVLPEGMKVSPSSANGLQSCSPAQFGYRTDSTVTCPDASKIGVVSIRTPLLDEPMRGAVYLARQNDNPFGSLLALYIHVQGTGQQIKLAGRVDPDPITGRLTTTFDDNPQLPFERLDLRLKSGPRAPLTNPQTCGTYHSETTITSWAGHSVSARTPMTIDEDCLPVGFDPSFEAGSVNPVGGASSSFSVTFGRGDHDQELGAIAVDMPEGLTGKVADAVLCADAQANAGACGEGSLIGSVTSAAGPGSQPYWLPGRVYLTEGYKGGQFGLSIVVPAVAGPFDLGNVVVRAAIFVDRNTAKLRVVSDPMPRILQGIVLQVRTVNVAIDKPGFMINPTSCNPKQVRGHITSQQGSGVDRSARFQVGGCAALRVRPRIVLTVGARGKTGRDRRTPLTARLTFPRGQGNARRVDVILPKTLNGRLDVIQRDKACTIEQFQADRCPNPIGEGVATTPLLRDPLRGPAYFVYNPARRLPDIVVRLRGQVNIDLVGKVTIPRDLTLRTSFDTVPDVPVTMFRLRLTGDQRQGPVGVVTNLCTKAGRSGRARIALVGHNGRRVDVRQKLRINGCGRAQRRSAKRQAKRQRAKRSAAVRAAVRAVEADARR